MDFLKKGITVFLIFLSLVSCGREKAIFLCDNFYDTFRCEPFDVDKILIKEFSEQNIKVKKVVVPVINVLPDINLYIKESKENIFILSPLLSKNLKNLSESYPEKSFVILETINEIDYPNIFYVYKDCSNAMADMGAIFASLSGLEVDKKKEIAKENSNLSEFYNPDDLPKTFFEKLFGTKSERFEKRRKREEERKRKKEEKALKKKLKKSENSSLSSDLDFFREPKTGSDSAIFVENEEIKDDDYFADLDRVDEIEDPFTPLMDFSKLEVFKVEENFIKIKPAIICNKFSNRRGKEIESFIESYNNYIGSDVSENKSLRVEELVSFEKDSALEVYNSLLDENYNLIFIHTGRTNSYIVEATNSINIYLVSEMVNPSKKGLNFFRNFIYSIDYNYKKCFKELAVIVKDRNIDKKVVFLEGFVKKLKKDSNLYIEDVDK